MKYFLFFAAAATVTDNYFGKKVLTDLSNYCQDGLHDGRRLSSKTGIQAIRSNFRILNKCFSRMEMLDFDVCLSLAFPRQTMMNEWWWFTD